MLDRFADSVVSLLYNHCNLPESRRAIYIYGSKLTISTLLSICSILILSTMFGRFIYGISFVLIFVSLRLFLGGFHAETYRNCFLITNGTFLAACAAAMLLCYLASSIISLLVLAVATVTIFLLGPVKNRNHPISETAFQKNKRIGFLLLGIELSLCIALYGATKSVSLLSITVASFVAVAAMMIPPTLAERRINHE